MRIGSPAWASICLMARIGQGILRMIMRSTRVTRVTAGRGLTTRINAGPRKGLGGLPRRVPTRGVRFPRTLSVGIVTYMLHGSYTGQLANNGLGPDYMQPGSDFMNGKLNKRTGLRRGPRFSPTCDRRVQFECRQDLQSKASPKKGARRGRMGVRIRFMIFMQDRLRRRPRLVR